MNATDARVYELLQVLKEYFDSTYPVHGAAQPFDNSQETFAERVEALLAEFRQQNN